MRRLAVLTRSYAPPQVRKICLDTSHFYQHLSIDHLCAIDLLMISLRDLIHVIDFVQHRVADSLEVMSHLLQSLVD